MDLVAIGFVRTSWGVKGWLKLGSYSGEWDHFRSLRDLVLRKGGAEKRAVAEGFRMQGDSGLMKLAGTDTPEAGRAWAGWEIFVPPSDGAALGEDEWYIRDLVGLAVVGSDGTAYGTIVSVVESADDLLEVERADGSAFFVPFRREFTGEPDLGGGTLELTAPWLAEKP